MKSEREKLIEKARYSHRTVEAMADFALTAIAKREGEIAAELKWVMAGSTNFVNLCQDLEKYIAKLEAAPSDGERGEVFCECGHHQQYHIDRVLGPIATGCTTCPCTEFKPVGGQ